MGHRQDGGAQKVRRLTAPVAERLEPRQLMAASALEDVPGAPLGAPPGDSAPAATHAPRESTRNARRAARVWPRRGRNKGQPPPDVFATVLPPTLASTPDGVAGEGPGAPGSGGVTGDGPSGLPPLPPIPAPAPGGKLIRVDPGGAIPSVARAAALAQPGDVVLIGPGRYHESIRLTRSGTAERPIVFAAAAGGGAVTIDGTGFTSILSGNVSNIHLQNIVFENASNGIWQPAVQIRSGWRVTDCTVRNTQGIGAVVWGDDVVITRSVFEYNGQEGLTGNGSSNVLVKDSVTRYNNPGLPNPVWAGDPRAIKVNGLWYVDPTWQAGAGKWVETDRVTIDGMHSYGNHSVGIWFDYNNTNVVIRNSVVHDNLSVRAGAWWEATGISVELCTGPVLVENNTLYSHSGPNLIVQSSRNVTVRNNTIRGGYLAVQDWPRGASYTTQDVTVTNNRFTNGMYVRAEGGTWNSSSPATKRIRFDYNRWESYGGDLFRWGTASYRTLAQVQSNLGYEVHGTYTRL